MSAGLSLSLIVGGLFVVALVWVVVTRRGRVPSVVRSSVVWMRVPDSRDVHAIRAVELNAGVPQVDSVGLCGIWPLAALEHAIGGEQRCPVCVRAVEQWERGGT